MAAGGRPTITAFADSPDGGEGQARDMRVRWALEELGLPYDVRLLTFEQLAQPDYLRQQPFGQIPAYDDGDVALFESGAIVLHLAQSRPGLLPDDPAARARAQAWMFAALNTLEPPIVEREMAEIVERDESWYAARLPMLEERIHKRLGQLVDRLGDAEWLDGEFSAGDLLMVTVLRRMDGWGIIETHPTLAAYVARGEARPAFQRAFAAQLAVFEGRAGRD